MAMTNAERQAAYRRRQMQDADSGMSQINICIDYSSKLSLARLAKHYGITETELVERLVREEQSRLLFSMTTEQSTAYLNAAL